jgi:hypothetical protein
MPEIDFCSACKGWRSTAISCETMLPTSMAPPIADVVIALSSCRARQREREYCGTGPR